MLRARGRRRKPKCSDRFPESFRIGACPLGLTAVFRVQSGSSSVAERHVHRRRMDGPSGAQRLEAEPLLERRIRGVARPLQDGGPCYRPPALSRNGVTTRLHQFRQPVGPVAISSSGILPSLESQSVACANAPPEWINSCLRGNRQGNFYLQPATRMIAKTDLAAMAANHRLRRRQPKTRPPGRAVP